MEIQENPASFLDTLLQCAQIQLLHVEENKPPPAPARPVVIVHAGVEDVDPETRLDDLHAVKCAAVEAYGNLVGRMQGVDVVEDSLKNLESYFWRECHRKVRTSCCCGDVELEADAGIIDGNNLKSGFVGAVQGYKHPISLARYVLEKTDHRLIVGEGTKKLVEDIHGKNEEAEFSCTMFESQSELNSSERTKSSSDFMTRCRLKCTRRVFKKQPKEIKSESKSDVKKVTLPDESAEGGSACQCADSRDCSEPNLSLSKGGDSLCDNARTDAGDCGCTDAECLQPDDAKSKKSIAEDCGCTDAECLQPDDAKSKKSIAEDCGCADAECLQPDKVSIKEKSEIKELEKEKPHSQESEEQKAKGDCNTNKYAKSCYKLKTFGVTAFDCQRRLSCGTTVYRTAAQHYGRLSATGTVLGCGLASDENGGCVSVSGLDDRGMYLRAPAHGLVEGMIREEEEEARQAVLEREVNDLGDREAGAVCIDADGVPRVYFTADSFPWAYCSKNMLFYGCSLDDFQCEKLEDVEEMNKFCFCPEDEGEAAA